MSRVISRLLLLGGVLLLSIVVTPPPCQGDRLIIATATGFVDTDAATAREEDILSHLKDRAEMMPDSFADIAAVCFSAASARAYTLGTMHGLASELDPTSPGINRAVQMAADDVRMLLQAHLLFKRLSENENRARLALGMPMSEIAA